MPDCMSTCQSATRAYARSRVRAVWGKPREGPSGGLGSAVSGPGLVPGCLAGLVRWVACSADGWRRHCALRGCRPGLVASLLSVVY